VVLVLIFLPLICWRRLDGWEEVVSKRPTQAKLRIHAEHRGAVRVCKATAMTRAVMKYVGNSVPSSSHANGAI
jgi:hypothetical protein